MPAAFFDISFKNVLYSAVAMTNISFPPFHNGDPLWCMVVEFVNPDKVIRAMCRFPSSEG